MKTAAGSAHIPVLDGIRGIAALMVMLFHGMQRGAFDGLGHWSEYSRVFCIGQTGVDLFFVLSGFLITRILIATRESPRYFSAFYARRALRIFPLYYFYLTAFYFIFPLFSHAPYVSPAHAWWYWVYLQNVADTFLPGAAEGPGHFWSLAVEEHFYLLWPLLVWVTPLRRLHLVSLVLIVLAFLVRALFLYSFGLGVFVFTLCRMDALAFGTLLACLAASGQLERLRWIFVTAIAIGLPILCLAWLQVSGEGTAPLQMMKYTFAGLLYTAVLGAVISFQRTPWLVTLLANGPLRFAGRISYGLYVYQAMVLTALYSFPFAVRHGLLSLFFGILVTFLVSWISFQYLESPFLRLKRFWQSDEPRPAPVPAVSAIASE